MKEWQKQSQKKSFNSHFRENSSVNGIQHKNVGETDLIKETLFLVATENVRQHTVLSGCTNKKGGQTPPFSYLYTICSALSKSTIFPSS